MIIIMLKIIAIIIINNDLFHSFLPNKTKAEFDTDLSVVTAQTPVTAL